MIPLVRPHFGEEEIAEIKKVLDSGWVAQGPKAKEFEVNFARYVGAKNAIPVSNCTVALHLALLAIGIKKGDEVLVADYTFPATGHSVLYCCAKPVFVDVDPKTYNIDTNKIREHITKKTKAIIPVHTFGQSADMSPIMEVAEEKGLSVIEDSACSAGARYKNRYSGTIGDIGCFSFHARKGITTGEGGMVVTDSDELAAKIRNLSVFGMTSAWDREKSKEFTIPTFVNLGYNYKLSDVAAAIGVAQLKKIEQIVEKKQKLASYWDQKLNEAGFITPPYVDKRCRHVYQSYVGLVDSKINRNKLIESLNKEGVQTQIGTYSSFIQPIYKSGQKCPVSLDLYNRAIALPMYYGLEKSDIDIAAAAIEKCCKV